MFFFFFVGVHAYAIDVDAPSVCTHISTHIHAQVRVLYCQQRSISNACIPFDLGLCLSVTTTMNMTDGRVFSSGAALDESNATKQIASKENRSR